MNLQISQINNNLKTLKTFIRYTCAETPWIRAVGILSSTGAGLIFLNSMIPNEISIPIKNLDPEVYKITLISILILYFFLVSIFSGDKLRFEKKLRELEQNFKYDKRGTLYNGSEPNIAFRIVTFKGMMAGLTETMGADILSSSLTDTGRRASKDFALNFEDIYTSEIETKKSKSPWKQLSLTKKLSEWADYDSSTGWGILTCKLKDNLIKIEVTHLQDLFADQEGLMFGHFLSGYAETIISVIIKTHNIGKFLESEKVELINIKQIDRHTINIEYNIF